jgi:hypothetical protein
MKTFIKVAVFLSLFVLWGLLARWIGETAPYLLPVWWLVIVAVLVYAHEEF